MQAPDRQGLPRPGIEDAFRTGFFDQAFTIPVQGAGFVVIREEGAWGPTPAPAPPIGFRAAETSGAIFFAHFKRPRGGYFLIFEN